MNVRGWYEADALMSDLMVHRHSMMGCSEGEIEFRLRDLYAGVVAMLAYRQAIYFPTDKGRKEP